MSGRKGRRVERAKPDPTHQNEQPPAGGPYSVLFCENNLRVRVVEVSHPLAYGREILRAAGMHPRDELDLVAIRPSGQIEDVPLDQLIDLRGRGADRFLACWRNRTYKLRIDGRLHLWPWPVIGGTALYDMAELKPGYGLWQKVRGRNKSDLEIELYDVVDLSNLVIQRFESDRKYGPGWRIIVNGRVRSVMRNPVPFEEIVRHAFEDAEGDGRFLVEYRRALSDPTSGELLPGGSS